MIIIDRFEGDFAVLEKDGKITHERRTAVCGEAKEGDVLIFENDKYFVDVEETKKRREEILAFKRRISLLADKQKPE